MNKARKIQQRLASLEQRLANAEKYVTRGINVESNGFLHLDDWQGKGGHPSWMKNWMIPRLKKNRAHTEKVLEAIDKKTKDKTISERKRRSGSLGDHIPGA